MDLGLADRVYVVTGGSKGLGFATARALVDDGARVVLVSRSADSLTAAAEQLGERARVLAADMADPTLPSRAVDEAVRAYGRIDGGLISVGGPPPGTVLTTSDEQWRQAFESVFLGGIRMARTLCERMIEGGAPQGGAIAWVLSTSAEQVITGLTTSNGLRPGLAMVIKDLADEVGPFGIRVNGVLPNNIATDRLASLAGWDSSAGARERGAAGIPLRRYGEPAEFGRVAAFVLSPAASYVTGSLVRVDGGVTRLP